MYKLIEKFLDYMTSERNMAKNTVDNYALDLKQFADFVKKPLTKVTSSDISEFMVFLTNNGMSASTRGRKLSAIKSFYKFLIRKEKIHYNPAESVDIPKQERRLPKPINEVDINRMIAKTDNLRDKVMLEVLYGCGVRREELGKIRVRDIDFRNGFIRIMGKGGAERYVPVHPQALELIKLLIKTHNSEWLFPGRNGNHISNRQINAIVTKWADAAGIEGVTPHKFRHSFATHLMNNGAEIRVIQELLGHKNLNTTQIYTKVSSEKMRREYLQYHPRAMGQPV